MIDTHSVPAPGRSGRRPRTGPLGTGPLDTGSVVAPSVPDGASGPALDLQRHEPGERGASPAWPSPRLEHRCRRCGQVVLPRTEVHAVAWCGGCRRVGIARTVLVD